MREMKDSGIEWIGEIPKDWELAQVRYLFRIGRGRVIAQTEIEENGIYPVFSSQTKNNGCLGYINTYDFDLEQITWTTDGANAGTVFLRNGKHNCTNVCGTLQPLTKELNLRYQKYALEHIAFYHKRADTNGYKIMNNEMAAIHTIIPSYGEQEKIADYLDSKCSLIDVIIEKQQTIIEKLKEYKLAVITEAVTKGIEPDVEMKKCHIRKLKQIPINWDVIKITRILDYESSYPIGDGDHGLIKTENYKEEGIPYIRVQNLGWGTDLLLDNVIYISQEDHDKIKGSELHPNDILFCKTGATIGKTGMIPDNIPISNTTSHVGKITIDKKYNPRLVFYYLSSFIGYVQFWDIACMKSTRPELSIEEIRAIMIAIPRDREEQDVIVQYLDKKCAEIERIIANKEEIKSKLLEYKKSLIYEVVTGKKEV